MQAWEADDIMVSVASLLCTPTPNPHSPNPHACALPGLARYLAAPHPLLTHTYTRSVPTTAHPPGCFCRPCVHVHLWCVLT